MEFAILGPLSVRDDDGLHVVVSTPRLRSLLGALLISAGKVLSADALAELVWDGRPPPSARTTLHSYVARLRRALGPSVGERLVTVPAGYTIKTGEDELDLARFTRLRGAGLAAAREGDWAVAAEVLREAAGLWRGQVLADVPSQLVRQEEHRLEELRLQVLETKLHAESELGLQNEVIDEAQALVAEHPARERLWNVLILALYRASRHAEAAVAFQRVRQTLTEEYGIEPGAELAELQRRILAADPALMPGRGAGSTPPGPERVVPRQLPADTSDFVGRTRLLSGLGADLADEAGSRVVVLTGPAGMGKTALAVRLAHALKSGFPDGILFADLAAMGDTSRVLASFLSALGVTGQAMPDDAERVALYRSVLAERRVLVVLDNARDTGQVRDLLPSGPACRGLVTSRNRLTGIAGARAVELEGLTDAEALELLTAVVGADRLAGQDEAVARVVAACGRLPLALRIAASRLAVRPGWDVAHLADRLTDGGRGLEEFEAGDLSVRASFGLSYAALPEEAVRCFRLLAVPDVAALELPVAAAAVGVSAAVAERWLEGLLDANLLLSPAPGRYGYHDLLRAYARELAEGTDEPAERDAVLVRVIKALGAALPRSATDEADAAALSALVCEDLVRCAVQAGAAPGIPASVVAKVALRLYRPLTLTGRFDDLRRCGEAAMASALRDGDQRAESAACRVLGWVALNRGDPVAAGRLLERGLDLATLGGDPEEQAYSHLIVGVWRGRTGEREQAIPHLDYAAHLFEARGLPSVAAVGHNYLAEQLLHLGRPDEALTRLHRALGIARSVGDVDVESMSLQFIGTAYLGLGDTKAAVRYGLQGMVVARARQSRHSEAIALTHLGRSLLADGQEAEGRAHLLQAAGIFHEIGDRPQAAAAREAAKG